MQPGDRRSPVSSTTSLRRLHIYFAMFSLRKNYVFEPFEPSLVLKALSLCVQFIYYLARFF